MDLSIIADISETEDVKIFCDKLKEVGVKTKVIYEPTGFLGRKAAMMPTFAMLWISSKTSDLIFNIANERNEKNLTNINYFADSVALSESQKNAVGRNHSVFASLSSDHGVAEVVCMVETTPIPTSNQTLSVQDKTIETKLESQGENEKSVVNQSYVENSKGINSAVDSMNESEQSDEKEKIYSPWKALVIIIAVYIIQLFINQWLDFRVNELYPYIMHIICLFICKACIEGVKQYQIKDGKSILSTVVVVIGWLSLLGYVYLIIVNLYSWLFD